MSTHDCFFTHDIAFSCKEPIFRANPDERQTFMAFRADEAAQDGYERARRILVLSPGVDADQREKADGALQDLIDTHGPVVRGYPTWHPLVPQDNPQMPVTDPSDRCGYQGLDHTIYFAHAFVSCPYGDGSKIIESVEAMEPHPCATITAKRNVQIISKPGRKRNMPASHGVRRRSISGCQPARGIGKKSGITPVGCCWLKRQAGKSPTFAGENSILRMATN